MSGLSDVGVELWFAECGKPRGEPVDPLFLICLQRESKCAALSSVRLACGAPGPS